jgi:hypothetical protein
MACGWYRTDDGQSTMHVHWSRKGGPASCVGQTLAGDNLALGNRCGRVSVALCDGPAGQDLGGRVLTCDAPICTHHRTSIGPNRDLCPRCSQKTRDAVGGQS